jgi:hypothetical protein
VANLSGFNANEVEPNAARDLIPPGEYDAVIVSSEMKPTKDGTGAYLDLALSIINGTHQNRQLFDKLNLKNKNEEAVRIAKGTLSAICRAVNVLTPNDSSELHMKPLRISVTTKKRADNGELKNEIKGYKPRNATPPAAPALGPAGVAPSLPTGNNSGAAKAPWLS